MGRAPDIHLSDPINVADPVDMGVSFDMPPCFLGITLYDGSGDVVESGATGTFEIKIKSQVSEVWQDAKEPLSIDVADYKDVDWLRPTRMVRVTPNGITGATTYRVRVVQYGAR